MLAWESLARKFKVVLNIDEIVIQCRPDETSIKHTKEWANERQIDG